MILTIPPLAAIAAELARRGLPSLDAVTAERTRRTTKGKPTQPRDKDGQWTSGGGGGGALSDKEKATLEAWSSGATTYRSLRNPKTAQGQAFGALLEKLPVHHGEVWRGMALPARQAERTFVVGKTFTTALHASTSKSSSVARDFAEEYGADGPRGTTAVILKMKSKTGRDVSKHVAADFRSQREVVVPAGSRYRITATKAGKLRGDDMNMPVLHVTLREV